MSIEQAVYYRTVGQGENLVLLHGWAANSVVWQPVIEILSQYFCLYLVDLPGFGKSKGLSEYTLQTMVEALMEVLPKRAVWCGWSLGGVLATYAAYHYPERISKLIQVCSSVKFVSAPAWSGVESVVFDNFKQGIQSQTEKTLTRFVAIQSMGCATARQDALFLKKLLLGTPAADKKALLAGLIVLNDSDLRKEFTQLAIPCLALFGQFDGLVPVQACKEMQRLLPEATQKIFKNSAHLPFISEPDEFMNSIINFICD